MISRRELEQMIVVGLGAIRRAETDLDYRLKARLSGKQPSLGFTLADLNAQAEQLEALLDVLDDDGHRASLLAA